MTYRTANLQSCILYIYSTNICAEYFKHGVYSPFFSSSKCSLFHNSIVFGSYIIHILYTGCAKTKKNNFGSKSLISKETQIRAFLLLSISLVSVRICMWKSYKCVFCLSYCFRLSVNYWTAEKGGRQDRKAALKRKELVLCNVKKYSFMNL